MKPIHEISKSLNLDISEEGVAARHPTLNPDQCRAYTFIVQMLFGQTEVKRQHVILSARAGTGKTYLLRLLVIDLWKHTPLITASTHEAKAILASELPPSISVTTTHSALGFRAAENEDGTVAFKQSFAPNLSSTGFIIIEEVSMTEELVINAAVETGLPILAVGNKNQLPPVNTSLRSHQTAFSPVFLREDFTAVSLTQPMRNTTNIYEYCNKIADAMDNSQPIPITSPFDTSEEVFFNTLNDSTTHEGWLNGSTVFIGHYNQTVAGINRRIRRVLFPTNTLTFTPRDRIVITAPALLFTDPITDTLTPISFNNPTFSKENFIELPNNCKLEVITVNPSLLIQGIDCYELSVKTYGFDIQESTGFLYIPKSPNNKSLTTALTQYRSAGLDKLSTPVDRKTAWAKFYFLQKLFLVSPNKGKWEAKWLYAFAGTAYRFQGATRNIVWVYLIDFKNIPNRSLARCSFYTAVTRAKDSLHTITKQREHI